MHLKLMRFPWRSIASLALTVALALGGILGEARWSAARAAMAETAKATLDDAALQKAILRYQPDKRYRDDAFVLATVKEAAQGWREHNGGIGACLVREASGEIVACAHNSQYVPYFRSDLHAEMKLLDKYEDRVRTKRASNPHDTQHRNPRYAMEGLVLYTSVEPCPMCLARIINSGLKKVYYASADETGGMAKRLGGLPPFWQNMAAGMVSEPSQSSPQLNELAHDLFHPMHLVSSAH